MLLKFSFKTLTRLRKSSKVLGLLWMFAVFYVRIPLCMRGGFSLFFFFYILVLSTPGGMFGVGIFRDL